MAKKPPQPKDEIPSTGSNTERLLGEILAKLTEIHEHMVLRDAEASETGRTAVLG